MASPIDLVSLGDLKSWLDVSSADDDLLLARLIRQISRAILSLTGRAWILPQPYTEIYDGGGDVSLLLHQWPVTNIASCVIDGAAIPPSQPLGSAGALQPGYILDPADPSPPGKMQRLSLRGFRFASGLQNVKVSYTAGYQITNERVIVPAGQPYAIEAQAPFGSWASDCGVSYENGLPLSPVTGSPSAGQYTVTGGVYSFAQADSGAPVLLTYGYVPADLASCCMEWVAERYAYRSRIGQQSKSLGGQETVAFIVKDIPDFVAQTLAPYRRIVAL